MGVPSFVANISEERVYISSGLAHSMKRRKMHEVDADSAASGCSRPSRAPTWSDFKSSHSSPSTWGSSVCSSISSVASNDSATHLPNFARQPVMQTSTNWVGRVQPQRQASLSHTEQDMQGQIQVVRPYSSRAFGNSRDASAQLGTSPCGPIRERIADMAL